MDKLSFSLLEILVDSSVEIERFNPPTNITFSELNKDTQWVGEDGTFYDVEIENTNQYLWLYFQFGNTSPRSETVTNVDTGEQFENQRKENEAELLNQLFVMYSYTRHTLYVSNTKKIKLLQQFLKDNTNKDIEIKHFFKTPEEMIELLSSVSSIKFTSASNLFNQDSPERKALVDLTGTDAPESFTIEATYKAHKIKNFVYDLIHKRQNSQIQNLVICGRDTSDIELVYNIDTLTHKIEILCNRQEKTGMFEADEVKLCLLNKLFG